MFKASRSCRGSVPFDNRDHSKEVYRNVNDLSILNGVDRIRSIASKHLRVVFSNNIGNSHYFLLTHTVVINNEGCPGIQVVHMARRIDINTIVIYDASVIFIGRFHIDHRISDTDLFNEFRNCLSLVGYILTIDKHLIQPRNTFVIFKTFRLVNLIIAALDIDRIGTPEISDLKPCYIMCYIVGYLIINGRTDFFHPVTNLRMNSLFIINKEIHIIDILAMLCVCTRKHGNDIVFIYNFFIRIDSMSADMKLLVYRVHIVTLASPFYGV